MERNKDWRNKNKNKKYKNRLKNFGLFNNNNPEEWTFCYKNTSTPCSCIFCDPHKQGEKKRFKIKHKKKFLEEEINSQND